LRLFDLDRAEVASEIVRQNYSNPPSHASDS
jgi:hypothetical protein